MKLVPVLVLGLSAIAPLSFAQDFDPMGSGRPVIYKMSDLPIDLVPVEIQTTSDNLRSLFQMSMITPSMGNPNSEPGAWSREMMFRLSDVIWAGTDQLTGNGEYIIGYKLDVPKIPTTNDLSPDRLQFRLIYVRRQSVLTFTPRPEFSPKAMKEMTKQKPAVEATMADRTITLSNLKQVGTAAMIFLADSDDIFPWVQSTPQYFNLLEPYTKNREVFKTKNPSGGYFRFNMSLAGVSAIDISNPAETPMFYESEVWPDGKRGVCYVDSHAKFVDNDEWQRMQPLLKLNLKRHGKPIPPQVK